MRNTLRLGLSLFALLLFAVSFAAAQEAPAAERLEGLDEFIEGLLEQWEVPGLAVAVVSDGEVIYCRGFGLRDTEAGLAVTPRTLFAIGSTTKAFTVMAMGILVDEGKLAWDTPVADYLPDFRLYDEYATARMTPRDLVCHRSGLPRHDLMWYGSPRSRVELYERLRYLEPSEGFRDVWQYQNLMFMTAGYLVGEVADTTWEEFVRERIFEPLGMSGSNFSVTDSQEADDYALPYVESDDELELVPFRNIDAIGPAGSINSNVEEMARWITLHLNKGMVGETRLVVENTLAEMHMPQMAIRQPARHAETPIACYGLGWSITPYRGHHMLQHGGGIDGFITVVSFMPFDNIGVVVLTNKSPNPLPQIVSYNVYDSLLGLDPVDWNGRFREAMEEAEEEEGEGEEEADPNRQADTTPSHPLADYAGEFEHPGYGSMSVTLEDDVLSVHYNGGDIELEHYHYDVFRIAGDEFEGMRITFGMNESGDIETASVPLQEGVSPIVFTRLPEEAMFSREFLEQFVGEYEMEEFVVTIELRGENTLVAIVPGQPTYELEPMQGTQFRLKDMPGFSVEFQLDGEGNVTGAAVTQPNGVFTATRR